MVGLVVRRPGTIDLRFAISARGTLSALDVATPECSRLVRRARPGSVEQAPVLHSDRTVGLRRDLGVVRDEDDRVTALLRQRGEQVDDFRAGA